MIVLRSKDGTEIKIYSSGKECSIGLYSIFNRYLISDIGLEYFRSSVKRAKAFLQEGMIEDCETELDNSDKSLDFIEEGINVLSYAFACIVVEIGGKTYSDKTEDGLKEIVNVLTELEITQGDIENSVELFKKKVDKEIEDLFPDLSNQAEMLMYLTKMKRLILLNCSLFQNEEVLEEDKLEIRKQKNWFSVSSGAKKISELGIEIERNFFGLISFLELPESVSVIMFYSKLDYINKKNAQHQL